MRNAALVLTLFLAACVAQTPAVQMRFVDDVDGSPVADARITYCATAWEGTLTGHGGRSHTLFRIETATGANGELRLPPQEFDARPFGMSTNYDHAVMLVAKPGYETQQILNCCAALGEFAAASKWGYNGSTIRLKRAASGAEASRRGNPFASACGGGWSPPVDPRAVAPQPDAPPRPALAPQVPAEQHRSAAQPAAGAERR